MNSFLIVLIVLSALIFVHEIGHFLAAKLFGIKVEEFGVGYPPRIWGKKIGETIYSINLLPFGGFVRILGEEGVEDEKRKTKLKKWKRAFFAKNKKIRSLVALAGVFGNFLLGVFCFSLVYSFIGIPEKQEYIQIKKITENSPAQQSGLKIGDKILAIKFEEGIMKPKNLPEFIKKIEEYKGKEVELEILRGKQEMLFKITPRAEPPEDEGPLGVAISDIKMTFYPFWQMPLRSALVGVKEAIGWGLTVAFGVFLAIKQLIEGVVPEVAGPVGIYQLTTEVAKQGWMFLVEFVGILSINLAVLNILPFPALDGAKLAFIGVEAFLGRKVKPKIEQAIHAIGMTLLIFLMLLVTYNDIARLLKETSVSQKIKFLLEFLAGKF